MIKLARNGERIHLSIPKQIDREIAKRKERRGFNASKFFVKKYKEEFQCKSALLEAAKYHQEELDKIKKRLALLQDCGIKVPNISDKRCPICTMFFREDVTIRQRHNVYKNLDVCKQCWAEQRVKCEDLAKEIKESEPSE